MLTVKITYNTGFGVQEYVHTLRNISIHAFLASINHDRQYDKMASFLKDDGTLAVSFPARAILSIIPAAKES